MASSEETIQRPAKSNQDPVEDGISSDDDNDDDSAAFQYCTFAVTGAIPSFQPIFICHDCFNENAKGDPAGRSKTPLCICQACADICHDNAEHDVEYIGMGPSYCDCDHVGNCSIYQNSLLEAERMGAVSTSTGATPEEGPGEVSSDALADHRHLQAVYNIASLQDPLISNMLVQQAQELIQHSKDTFWVDAKAVAELSVTGSMSETTTGLCWFERLAWELLERHQESYPERLKDVVKCGGAEWWVQVKEDTSDTDGKEKNNAAVAIDLHYDKDEALAETFGLGSFPTLSTVTYLTPCTATAAPTIVLDHTYAQGEDEMMTQMLVSRPKLGKHLVFDGMLLHGAPAHSSLLGKPKSESTTSQDSSDIPTVATLPAAPSPSIRVTFLVNLWNERRPANVHRLDDTIRKQLIASLPVSSKLSPNLLELLPLVLVPQGIPNVTLKTEDDLPDDLRHRIQLPFVSKGATWEEQLTSNKGAQDEACDEDEGLVVITFPPPPFDDSLQVTFDGTMQAYLDYSHEQPEADQPQEQDASKSRNGKEAMRESGYV